MWYEDLLLFEEDVPWEESQRALEEEGIGDGLPLVPPTRARLEQMLAGVRIPDRSLGQVPPMFGELTPAAVAYNCVLAGCRRAELAVVASAVAACLADRFNLLGIQTTTGTPTVAVVVHGPVAARLGMNSGTNCLGPGNRANACIGRAVQLCLVNIGGARPEIGDMATMGQPGKYTFCLAEGNHRLVPPLHVRRGFAAEDSAVTVLGVSGTAEILPFDDRDTPEAILGPVGEAMGAARLVSGAGRSRPAGEQFFLLPPELAELLAGHGWTLRDIQEYLFTRTRRSREPSETGIANGGSGADVVAMPEDIQPVVAGGAGIKMTYLPLWMGGTRSVTAPLLPLD